MKMNKKIVSLILALGMVMSVAGAAQASYLQGDILSFDGTSSDIQINFNRSGTLIHYDGDLQVETADKIALSGDEVQVMHNMITFNPTQTSIYGDPTIDFGTESSVIRRSSTGLEVEADDRIKLVADDVRIDHNLLSFVADTRYPIAKIDFGSGDSEIYEDGQLIITTDNYLDVKPGTATRFGGGYGDTGVDITSTGNVSMDGDLVVGGSITGTATIATLSVTGNTTLGDGVEDDIVFNGYVASDMLPGTDGTYDIGSGSYEWQDLYVDGTANLDDVTITGTVTATGATLTGFDYLPLAGGEMSGNITFAAAQTVDGVDISALAASDISDVSPSANYLPLAGGTMTGQLQVDSAAANPSTIGNGSLYYHTGTNELRVDIDGSWATVRVGASGAGNSLDTVYDNGINATVAVDAYDVSWDLSSTYDFVVDIQGTGNFDVQDGSTSAFTVANGGVVTIAGSAEGTDTLVLTAGDLTVTDGDLTLSGGELAVSGATAHSLVSSGGAITVTAGAASTWSTTVGNIIVAASDTGDAGTYNLILRAGDSVTGAGGDGNDVAIEAEDAFLVETKGAVDIDSAVGVTIDGTNFAWTPTGTYDVDATGAVTIDSDGAFTLAATATSVDLSKTGVATTVKGTLNVDEAVTLDTSFDVDGAANISDTTADSDVTMGNSTGNLTFLSDNADFTLTDATDNVFQLVNSGNARTYLDVDAGAADTVTLGNTTDTTSVLGIVTVASTGALSLDSSTNAIESDATSFTADAAFTLTSGGGAALNLDSASAVITTNATSITADAGLTIESATTSALTLDSGSTGTIAIGTDADAEAINLGTGAAVKTVTLGSVNTTSPTLIQSGSGDITLDADAVDDSDIIIDAYSATNATGLIDIDAGSEGIDIDVTGAGNIALDSSGGTINLGSAGATAINIGAQVADNDINIGEVNDNVAIASASWSVTDAGVADATSLTLDNGGAGLDTAAAGELKLGGANATSITTGATVTTFSLAGTGLTTVNIATANTGAATLNLGTTDLANVVNMGGGTGIDDINIGYGTGADTIDIGVADGGKTILIGTNDGTADTVTIGSAKDATTITGDDWSVTNAGVAILAQLTVDNAILNADKIDTSGNAFEIDTANADLSLEAGTSQVLIVGTGNSEGTDSLTVQLGDVTVTEGDLTVAGGEVAMTSDTTSESVLTLSSVADSSAGPLDLAPDMVSGTIIDATVTGAPVLSGALIGLDIDLSNAVEDTNDQNTTGIQIVMDDNDASAVDTLGVDIDGTADHGIDMSGLTAGTADILLSNSEQIQNITDGSITFSDGTNTMIMDIDATAPQILISKDASIATSDGTNDTLEIDPYVGAAGYVVPGGASEDVLGSATLEWKELYLGDDNGIQFGAGQDVILAYDETTDDRLELTSGAGAAAGEASLYIEDVLSLGKQAETINGADDSVTIVASYLEVTATAATDDIILADTGALEGDLLFIVNVAANTFQLDGDTATMKIDGGTDADVLQYEGVIFIFDGTNWIQLTTIPTNA